MKDVETPQANIPFVDATGALTTHGLIVLQKMAEAVRELQAAKAAADASIAALEVSTAALEARVTALEALHP